MALQRGDAVKAARDLGGVPEGRSGKVVKVDEGFFSGTTYGVDFEGGFLDSGEYLDGLSEGSDIVKTGGGWW